ncbi:MAG TPA: serine protease, partial [Burkholderiales bacterium]|nr:serine protease [Burkholderiales bacterium]
MSLPAATPARAESLPVGAELLRSGSGFAVAPGVVVTNAHVVEGCRALRVLHGEQARGGRVLAIDREQDLAAVQSDLAVPAVLALRASPALRVGESVVAFGFPLTGSLSREGNLTTGNVSALAGLRDDARYLQITAPVQPGNSGGPLLDEGANVVGVIAAKLDAVAIAKRTGDIPQNVNFAVNGQSLERFLQDARIGYEKQVT